MVEKKITQRLLFLGKRATIEKRMADYLEATNDVDSVVQYTIALLVRNALTLGDFSFILKDLIREIFLTTAPNDRLRQYALFFRDYFTDDWNQVESRLFPNKKTYRQFAKKMQIYTKYLQVKSSDPNLPSNQKISLVSGFKDANGKDHTWTLRDADPARTKEEVDRLLSILTTLTVFKKDGTRRFATLEYSNLVDSTITPMVERKTKVKKEAVKSATTSSKESKGDNEVDSTLLEGKEQPDEAEEANQSLDNSKKPIKQASMNETSPRKKSNRNRENPKAVPSQPNEASPVAVSDPLAETPIPENRKPKQEQSFMDRWIKKKKKKSSRKSDKRKRR